MKSNRLIFDDTVVLSILLPYHNRTVTIFLNIRS
jgi:hypothetical protein